MTCIDISEPILKSNEKLHPQAKFILADAANVKIDGQLDLIFVKDVIEHIKDDEQFLDNMNFHLKAGGLIMIITQNSWSLNYLIQGGYHFLEGDKNWCGWATDHKRFYNIKSLKKKLETEGFKTIKWFGNYYFPYRIIAEKMGAEKIAKIFCFPELINLYDKFPFNITGWSIGVIAQKNS